MTFYKMKNAFLILLIIICSNSYSQNKTDVSLFLKKNKEVYLNEVESESGNLFYKVGHHGPAVENEWLGFRIYFDKKGAIDIYSKANPGLELQYKKWYPCKEEQRKGWGADYYKVGKTVGLGGIKLWDGEEVIRLHPVTKRTAKVVKGETSSYMEMLSEGVPYKGKKVDILVRVTVFSDSREAKVEASVLTSEPVQFVTGINYHKGMAVGFNQNYTATWGIHPEDVAAEKVEVGAAIIYNKDDFLKKINDGSQHLLISKPTKKIETLITSVNAREPEINTYSKFIEYLNDYLYQ
jgi:hypothetical protein